MEILPIFFPIPAGLQMVDDSVCFSATCRFDQGAAVEGAGVGFLKNSVLNILFQMKERPSEKQA
ncbi:hypothetical protein [Neisseria meningitidis]|uniref:hypothetical protein n=1 Tax=Neisseria meningitidis TaxID=487 RepID=UPI001C570479|nr:hypothetical protein [Neisseria meningitidis]MBW3871690.1 hypothetical protein [Neisseria meningitidis]MBW3957032.1 hypothetical protein [Neisseria meningitidis]